MRKTMPPPAAPPDVGPVKELVNTSEGSATSVVADEELLSFTKG